MCICFCLIVFFFFVFFFFFSSRRRHTRYIGDWSSDVCSSDLINTGSELMLGRVLNTHQQWIGRHLADRGYVVTRQLCVPDAASDIQPAVREALSRADLVIVTGGLGPTSDDITRDLVAELLGKKMREDAVALANVESFFAIHKRPMPAQTRVQALVPEGADRKSVV